MNPVADIPGLLPLWRKVSGGDPRIRVAVLDGADGSVSSLLRGAKLQRLPTLISEPAGTGGMSSHRTHVRSIIFDNQIAVEDLSQSADGGSSAVA